MQYADTVSVMPLLTGSPAPVEPQRHGPGASSEELAYRLCAECDPSRQLSIADGIRRTSPHTFTVDPRVRTKLLRGDTESSKRLRVANVREVSTLDAGVYSGVEILGIRPNNFLGMLGLEPGDVLVSLGGYSTLELPSSQHFAELQRAEELVLLLVRKGKVVELRYRFQSL
jgi:hypothetical protein